MNQEEELSLMLASIEAYDHSNNEIQNNIDQLLHQRTSHSLADKNKSNGGGSGGGSGGNIHECKRQTANNFPNNYTNGSSFNNYNNSYDNELHDVMIIQSNTTVTTSTITSAAIPLNNLNEYSQVSIVYLIFI